MRLSRSRLLAVPLVAVSLALTACSSNAATAQPAASGANVSAPASTVVSAAPAHKNWLLNGSVVYGAGKLSGTFTGSTLVPGTAVHGSFTC